MNYQEAIQYLESIPNDSGRPSLTRIALFLRENRNPQDVIPAIHVGGTNGKGSTAVILSGLLEALDLKVGRLTGPHLFSWRERICINGKQIEESQFARIATRVKKLSSEFETRHPEMGMLSWYEFICVVAFFYFQEENVDVNVLEVGLGGRFDGTNAVKNVIASIITNIDLDHTHILGNTHAQIAFEKSGIMKPGVPVITASNEEALLELEKQARLKNTSVVDARARIRPILEGTSAKTECPFLDSSKYIIDNLSLLGPHQKVNASLALLALSESKAFNHLVQDESIEAMKNSLQKVHWPGRMQVFEDQKIILDVAHNPASAKALREALNQFSNQPYAFLIGCYRSKDLNGMLAELLTEQDSVIACNLNTKRKFFDTSEITSIARQMVSETIEMNSIFEGLDYVFSQKDLLKDKYLVVTGSFTSVKDSITYLEEQQNRLKIQVSTHALEPQSV